MHQTRAELTTKIPVPRRGTKYVARALSNLENSVPVVIAVRDMLKLARTSKEVKKMIKQKSLKINGVEVKDLREGIKLFNILEADKSYILTFSNVRKFVFEEIKEPKERLCKVIGKTILKKGKQQINLHDGTNILASGKINVGDSIYLDLSGNMTKHIAIEKGKEGLIISGKYTGSKGKIKNVAEKTVSVKIQDLNKDAEIEKSRIIVL